MRPRRRWAAAVCGIGLFVLAGGRNSPAQPPGMPPSEPPWTRIGPPPGLVARCDQGNPFSPARSTRITLDSRDLVGRQGRELRSFVATGSLGRADVAILGATPEGVVLGVSAIPEISRMSRYFGERLKGIALDVALAANPGPVQVVLELRQVCARGFRNTFLYY
jgi:hypothetical protein